jgi:hypothetical protein
VHGNLVSGLDGSGQPIIQEDGDFTGRYEYVDALTGNLASGTWAYNFAEFMAGSNNHIPSALEQAVKTALLSLEGLTY